MNNGLNYEDANALATKTVKSQWKVTNIGGEKKLQRYSPESQYHVNGVNDDWIKEQVLDTVSGVKGPDKPEGLITAGNIDLSKRPVLKNTDGSISTLRSITIEEDGKAVLIPTIQDGKQLTPEQAVNYYKRTGQNLGVFKTQAAAADYARSASEFEGQRFQSGKKAPFLGENIFTAPARAPKNFFEGKSREEINSEIELAVDPKSIQPGARPSYLVFKKADEYGTKTLLLDDNNQPVRFTPDFTKTEIHKKSELARQALSVSPEVFANELYKKKKSLDIPMNNYSLPAGVDTYNRRGFKNEPYDGNIAQ